MALMFQRLARNYSRAGYYPTDAATLESVLNRLQSPAQGSVRAIDPCAGEGVALAECKHHLGEDRVTAYGVEVDEERAWQGKQLLDYCLHADYQNTVITRRRFGLLWLNPPYGDLVADQGDTGDAQSAGRQRLEKLLYRQSINLLQAGGICVLIVPRNCLDPTLCGWLARDLEHISAWPAPEQRFRQTIVLGVRRPATERRIVGEVKVALRAFADGQAPSLGPLSDDYRVPAASRERPAFHGVALDARQVADEIQRYPGLWCRFEGYFGQTGLPPRRPLMPMSDWHLALSLAAGQVAGRVRSNDGTRTLLVKGSTHKEKRQTVERSERQDGSITETRTATDVFVPVIRAIDVTPGRSSFGDVLTIR